MWATHHVAASDGDRVQEGRSERWSAAGDETLGCGDFIITELALGNDCNLNFAITFRVAQTGWPACHNAGNLHVVSTRGLRTR